MQTMVSFGTDDGELESLGASLRDASSQVDAIAERLRISASSVGHPALATKVADFVDGGVEETSIILAMMSRLEGFLDQVVISTSEVDGRLAVDVSSVCSPERG